LIISTDRVDKLSHVLGFVVIVNRMDGSAIRADIVIELRDFAVTIFALWHNVFSVYLLFKMAREEKRFQ
jgi:hypothetical protein